MEKLRLDVESVRVMADRWHRKAAELGYDPPSSSGLSRHASVAAVNSGHADIAVATTVLTGRVRTTAAKVAEADTRYVANEANSAGQLAAVAWP